MTSVDCDGAGVKAGGVGGWGLKVRIWDGAQTLRSREHSHRAGTGSDNFFIKFGGRETRVG